MGNAGDSLGFLRKVFIMGIDLSPAAGSLADLKAKAVQPQHLFLTDYRPMTLTAEPWDPVAASAKVEPVVSESKPKLRCRALPAHWRRDEAGSGSRCAPQGPIP